MPSPGPLRQDSVLPIFRANFFHDSWLRDELDSWQEFCWSYSRICEFFIKFGPLTLASTLDGPKKTELSMIISPGPINLSVNTLIPLPFLPVICATKLLDEDVDSDMAWCFAQCYWNREIVVFGVGMRRFPYFL